MYGERNKTHAERGAEENSVEHKKHGWAVMCVDHKETHMEHGTKKIREQCRKNELTMM